MTLLDSVAVWHKRECRLDDLLKIESIHFSSAHPLTPLQALFPRGLRAAGSEGETIDLNAPAPVVIMMAGLQGSGKTTTTGKIAKRLTERQGKKVLMASLDTRRPAAQEQLRTSGAQTGAERTEIDIDRIAAAA